MGALPTDAELLAWSQMPEGWTQATKMSFGSQSYTSELLRAMEAKGLVRVKAQGRFRFYQPKASITIRRGA